MSKGLHERARAAFDQRFVHYEKVLNALLTAWAEFEEDSGVGANAILWGRGGFGKSEMAKTFAEVLEIEAFIQSFGASSSEEAIWGELDLAELRNGDAIKFHLKRCFLEWKFVILEEALDLPGRILDDFKDTLSARCFRRGVVQHPMKTRTIVICTNHDPEKFRKRSASADALMQRFPLQVEVEWPDYEAISYRKMYERQLKDYADLAPLFAMIAAGISERFEIISPREALHLVRTVVRYAHSQERKHVVAKDFGILVSVTRFGRQREDFREIIKDALDSCGTHVKLNGYRHEANAIVRELAGVKADELDRYVGLSSDLERVRDKIHALDVPASDGGFEVKQALLRDITKALREKE